MSEIRLDDGTINIEGEWLAAAELTNRIQEKMQSGDMKFTNLASALEELNVAFENSQTLEVRLVITKGEYERLKTLGGADDRENVRKSIMAYVGDAATSTASAAPQQKKKFAMLSFMKYA